MISLKPLFRSISSNIRAGRHLEAYAIFLIGVTLVILGLIGIVGATVQLSAILLALSFLVFHTTVEISNRRSSLDQVLRGRDDFGPFSKLLPGVRDLRIYGPTAVNVLINSADIRRFILDTGGLVRVIVLADQEEAVKATGIQLDDNLDLAQTLHASFEILRKLQEKAGFSYRLLPFNPGFSLIIVNANAADGYAIFESHGFMDDNIADRMHIMIRRRESPHWFAYWLGRFDAMWGAAIPPDVHTIRSPSQSAD
jgi:hypothetical protein